MKFSALSILAGAGVPLILSGTAGAGFVGITSSSKLGTYKGQTVCACNIFALFDRPGQDRFLSVDGTPNSPMAFEVLGGTFFQHPLGGDTAPNAALVAAFPSLAFDTFVTIGVKKVGAPGGQPGDSLVLTPGWPGFEPNFLGGNNIGWAVTQVMPQSDPFNPDFVNGNGAVLIGQFATLNPHPGGAVAGMFRILVISNNVGTQINIPFLHHDFFPKCIPGSGALGLLATAGLLGKRRRRGA